MPNRDGDLAGWPLLHKERNSLPTQVAANWWGGQPSPLANGAPAWPVAAA